MPKETPAETPAEQPVVSPETVVEDRTNAPAAPAVVREYVETELESGTVCSTVVSVEPRTDVQVGAPA